jgi:hypothetical protein
MEIKIYKNVYLRSNSNCYIVCKLTSAKNKKTDEITEYWTDERYFNTPNQALSYILNQKIRESDCKNLKGIKEMIVEFENYINNELNTDNILK